MSPAEFQQDLAGAQAGRFPEVIGETWRGPATRIVRLDEAPDEPLVEFVPDETGERYSLLEEPLIEGQPAYMALVGLSEQALPGLGLGRDALLASLEPSPEMQELVRRFVARVGLLNWMVPPHHDCIATEMELESSRFFRIHYDLMSDAAEPRRFANAIAWILQEALVLRRAAALWSALRRLRFAGDMKPLDRLWGRRGGTAGLFDLYLDRSPRWEVRLGDSVGILGRMINQHIKEAQPAARLSRQDWRRRARVVSSYSLTSQLQFYMPLAGLWLQFFDDVLRESEAQRHCRECGAAFAPKRVDQEFCSGKCGNRYRQRKRRATGKGRKTNSGRKRNG